MDYEKVNCTPFNEPVVEKKKIEYDEPPPPYDGDDICCSDKSIARYKSDKFKHDIGRSGLWFRLKQLFRLLCK